MESVNMQLHAREEDVEFLSDNLLRSNEKLMLCFNQSQKGKKFSIESFDHLVFIVSQLHMWNSSLNSNPDKINEEGGEKITGEQLNKSFDGGLPSFCERDDFNEEHRENFVSEKEKDYIHSNFWLELVMKVLDYCSLIILSIFVVEITVKAICLGFKKFIKDTYEVCST